MPTSTSEDGRALLAQLARRAQAEGLGRPRVCPAALPPETGERLRQFIAQGRHGSMDWLAARMAERESPAQLWPAARSAIAFALPYGQDMAPLQRLSRKSNGVISVYALNRDYHDIFKGKLKRIGQWLARETAAAVKVFVDTAPLMEKPLAQQAGLGWQGRHSNLVSRDGGSWFFLGFILTTAELPADQPEHDHCGSCRACLDICPTKAFPAPYQLDARRCISYLTIEHKDHIATEFRKPMGNRIYGCDDCLAVCPWNKYAQHASDMRLDAREDLSDPPLAMFLSLDDAGFRKMFAGSPVKRTGRNRFLRNCLIAAGNSGDAALVGPILAALDDESPLVRAMAVWALRQLDESAFLAQRAQRLASESDQAVCREWQEAA